MDNNIIGVLVAIALFLAGVFTKDQLAKRQAAKETVKNAKKSEEKASKGARKKYEARMAAAKRAAKQDILDRPAPADPVASLRERIHRHAAKRRELYGSGARQSGTGAKDDDSGG